MDGTQSFCRVAQTTCTVHAPRDSLHTIRASQLEPVRTGMESPQLAFVFLTDPVKLGMFYKHFCNSLNN